MLTLDHLTLSGLAVAEVEGIIEPRRLRSKISPTASFNYAIWRNLPSYKLEVNLLIIFIYLTPLIPLSLKGEGEIKKEGLAPLLDFRCHCSSVYPY